ncbi:B-type lectin plumieribetin-like [Clinocottus analis]|uniref:B-type lectin plumieribetin-like n=1 Tax=Clinocottus analis TaxID=304258 RepID=UPI0035C0AB6B
MSRNYLSGGNELLRGDYLMSNNNQWKAVFQDDGNFVVFGWKPVWASNTNRSDAVRLVMQDDCNLVTYNAAGVPKWDTNTHTNTGSTCHLQLTDDGKLALYKEAQKIWGT